LLSSACGGAKPVIVGSKSSTAHVVLGEIVAQHLEHRLGRKVERRLNMGNTDLAYQSLLNAEISLYAEETGAVQTEILKESPSSDAASTLERVRNEMVRLAQVTVLDPLGVENSWALVVKDKINTLTEAEQAKTGWKLGITRDFNGRTDGLAALNQYRLPLAAAPKIADLTSLYGGFEEGSLTMVAGNVTDGPLARHDDWKVLRDDKKVFPAYQTCLMVRSDVLLSDKKIEPALRELSGKITNDALRKLDAEVDVDHKTPAAVAAKFLEQAGLK
jgi:osmoprotectant transport system substrate-binding protein